MGPATAYVEFGQTFKKVVRVATDCLSDLRIAENMKRE